MEINKLSNFIFSDNFMVSKSEKRKNIFKFRKDPDSTVFKM